MKRLLAVILLVALFIMFKPSVYASQVDKVMLDDMLDEIKLDLAEASVRIRKVKETEEPYVQVESVIEQDKIEVELEYADGKLSLKSKSKKWGLFNLGGLALKKDFEKPTHRVEIILPDKKIAKLKINQSTGSLSASDLSVDHSEIKLDTGQMKLENTEIDKANIEVSVGNMSWSEGVVGDIKADISVGSFDFVGDIKTNGEIKSATGTVKLQLDRPVGEYSITRKGNVSFLNGEVVEDNKSGTPLKLSADLA